VKLKREIIFIFYFNIMEQTDLHYQAVTVAEDQIPPKSTLQMYDEFTEDLMATRFDSQQWLQTFKRATSPSSTDRNLIRGLRILIIRQTLQVKHQKM
jgi:hypothetical protein